MAIANKVIIAMNNGKGKKEADKNEIANISALKILVDNINASTVLPNAWFYKGTEEEILL